MPASEHIRALIAQRAERHQLFEQALSDGMITMAEDGLVKINAGLTTPSEVMKRLHNANLATGVRLRGREA